MNQIQAITFLGLHVRSGDLGFVVSILGYYGYLLIIE